LPSSNFKFHTRIHCRKEETLECTRQELTASETNKQNPNRHTNRQINKKKTHNHFKRYIIFCTGKFFGVSSVTKIYQRRNFVNKAIQPKKHLAT